jgi:ornithine carbamoyltransferase
MPERRHLISIDDLSDDDLSWIVQRGTEFSAGAAEDARSLSEAIVSVLFPKTSTRTRTAFSAGALRLGARLITFGPDDLQENTGESVEDTAAVLSRMIDVLVARTDPLADHGNDQTDAHWREVFAPFQVNEAVMAACPGAVFINDLPAHRGEEVTAAVLSPARSHRGIDPVEREHRRRRRPPVPGGDVVAPGGAEDGHPGTTSRRPWAMSSCPARRT